MQQTRERIFELWAPRESPWSVWTKPVLFAHLPSVVSGSGGSSPAIEHEVWRRRAPPGTALVVDLPGARSVELAEGLVPLGFRPVPLFNAVPASPEQLWPGPGYFPRDLVDVHSIVRALEAASLRLSEALQGLSADAPPAFLLDSERNRGLVPTPGDFDNRSISLPTDFPSAAFLQSRGVQRVLLVLDEHDPQTVDGQPSADLAHTLLRWQNGGLPVRACRVGAELRVSTGKSIVVQRPPRFRALWYGLLATLGLKRHPLGGFGGQLPFPSNG